MAPRFPELDRCMRSLQHPLLVHLHASFTHAEVIDAVDEGLGRSEER